MSSNNLGTAGQPLFIVDRDWLRQGSKARKSWTGNVRNRSLYGLAIQVTQQDLPGSSVRRKSHTKTKRRRREKQGETTDSESQGESEPSLPQNVLSVPTSNRDAAAAMAWPGHNIGASYDYAHVGMSGCVSTYGSWQANPALHSPTSSSSHGLDSVKGLGCFLDFYLDVIGTAQHPIETRFRFQSNPTQSIWLPFAYQDDLCLRDTTLLPTSYLPSGDGPPAEGANALICSLLSQLNGRIGKSDLSDNTIAIASCLTIGEHIRGNDQLARVHASGMAEMIRLRGGLHTIDRARRNKIVRADVIRSADSLEPPLLTRLSKDSLPPASSIQELSPQLGVMITSLSKTEVSPTLVSILWTLGSICGSLESDWKEHSITKTSSYYEEILCLNHDLLNFAARSAFDECLKLSMLNFTQPMFRYCAYTDHSCQVRSKALRSAMEQLYMGQCDQDVVLWLTYLGFMMSQQTSERSWFKAQLLTILGERDISGSQGWRMLRECLTKILWTECIHESAGKQFYDHLEHDEQVVHPPRLHNMCMTCSRTIHCFGAVSTAARTMSVSSANSIEQIQTQLCPA